MTRKLSHDENGIYHRMVPAYRDTDHSRQLELNTIVDMRVADDIGISHLSVLWLFQAADLFPTPAPLTYSFQAFAFDGLLSGTRGVSLAAVIGLTLGMINGFIISRFKLNTMIVTLGTTCSSASDGLQMPEITSRLPPVQVFRRIRPGSNRHAFTMPSVPAVCGAGRDCWLVKLQIPGHSRL